MGGELESEFKKNKIPLFIISQDLRIHKLKRFFKLVFFQDYNKHYNCCRQIL